MSVVRVLVRTTGFRVALRVSSIRFNRAIQIRATLAESFRSTIVYGTSPTQRLLHTNFSPNLRRSGSVGTQRASGACDKISVDVRMRRTMQRQCSEQARRSLLVLHWVPLEVTCKQLEHASCSEGTDCLVCLRVLRNGDFACLGHASAAGT